MIDMALVYMLICAAIFFGTLIAVYLTNPGDDDDIDND